MKILLAVTLALAIAACEARYGRRYGRRCWHCENAKSDHQCYREGYLETCLYNQHHCQTEYRAIASNMYMEVTKRCKQERGCNNNAFQNENGPPVYQCLQDAHHEVCRCCCSFNNCNAPYVSCLQEPPNCPAPETMENGIVTCSNNAYPVGTECCYKCKGGYTLVGDMTTDCVYDAGTNATKWTNPPPRCETRPCEPPRESPENGQVVCTDGNNIGSVCTFECFLPFVLSGWETNTCSHLSIWDNDPPVCVPGECKAPHPVDPNSREVMCTDKYNVNSVCQYECNPGYDMVGFSDEIECQLPIRNDGYARWNRPPPKCELGECPVIRNTTTTKVICSNGNKVGSKCEIVCDPSKGRWMSDRNKNSVEGATRVTECGTDKNWSEDPDVTCSPITCEPPMDFLGNGTVTCSNSNRYQSTCTFQCDPRHTLTGAKSTRCDEDYVEDDPFGEWTNPLPECKPQCDEIIERTIKVSCTRGTEVGSVCTLVCNPEEGQYMYRTIGGQEVTVTGAVDRVTCMQDSRWSKGQIPRCKPVTCVPPTVAPGNGTASCTNRNFYASVCTYNCNDGYKIVDPDTETRRCDDDKTDGDEPHGRWSTPPAVCERDQCDNINEVTGVTKFCTDGNNVGSTCSFRCDDPDSELIGNERVTCEKDYGFDPNWNPNPNARCQKKQCTEYPGFLPPAYAGELKCDETPNYEGDQCVLECYIRDGYRAKDMATVSTCSNKDWTDKELCCVRCEKNDNLDILLLIDSGEASYMEAKKEFLLDLFEDLRMTYSFDMNITLVPYSTNVDVSSMSEFIAITPGSNETSDVEGVLDNFSPTRGVSNLGRALRWANDQFFDSWTEYRVPMVFVVSARDPADDISSIAETMNKRYIHLRVLPVTGPETMDDTGLDLDVWDPPFTVTYGEFPDHLTAAAEGLVDATRAVCNEKTQGTQFCERDDFFG